MFIIDDDDFIFDFFLERWIVFMIGNMGMFYWFLDDFVYKFNMILWEVELMEVVGSFIMWLLSRVVWKGFWFLIGIKVVIMEGGEFFCVWRIFIYKWYKCVVEMFFVVENLYKRGIVYGNIKELKFIWGNCRFIFFFLVSSSSSW